MTFKSATYQELDQSNPDKVYRMLPNGIYVREEDAQAIRMEEKGSLDIAYKVASGPRMWGAPRDQRMKTVLTEIKDKGKLKDLSALI